MVRPHDNELKDLLKQFVPVRLLNMSDADLDLFKFDYDLTWAGLFLSADERVYSRFGGRDAKSAEGRITIAGLKYTMRRVLAHHQQRGQETRAAARRPVRPADLFAVKGKCLHCHQVWEGLRKQARHEGRFDPESLNVYPLPENIGLQLDLTIGNQVVTVTPASPAYRAGVQAGDLIIAIRGLLIFSQADVRWALHNSPAEGRVPVQISHNAMTREATLLLSRGWKQTDLSWRPSMRKEKDK